jgi:hypothetical protein
MELQYESIIIRRTSILTYNMLKRIPIWKLEDQNRSHSKQA